MLALYTTCCGGCPHGNHANNNSSADASAGEASDDEDRKIYNPLKLPTGWDGKPIPFWLYKLHDMGRE